MNIAIFSDEFLPQINGVVTYVIDTAIELTALGHKVIVFVPKPRRGYKLDVKHYPFKIVMLPSLPAILYPDFRLTIPSLPRVLYQLQKYKVNVVHIMDPLTVGTDGIIAAKIMKTPIAITFHTFFMDEDMLRHFHLHKRENILRTPLWKLTAYYHNLADVVICPSKISQKELERFGLKKPTSVISNGITLEKIKKLTDKEIYNKRQFYGISPLDKVGIYVGRLSIDKSINILISAWRLLLKKIPQAKLLVVGSGPEEEKLKHLVSDLNISTHVIFTGPMSREDIIGGVYSLADIFVTASKIENQSLSMLEAMAFGLPIVGVDARGTPELVDKSNGLIVEPDNPQLLSEAIIKIFNDERLAAVLGKNSCKKVQELDIKITVKKLEALYRILSNFKTIS